MGTFNDGDSGSSIRTKINTAIQKTEGTSAISTIDVDGGAIDGVTIGTNSAVTDLRVDNLKADGNTISTTNTNGNLEFDPNGSGKAVFKGNSTKGAGQFILNCEQNSHGITIKGPPHSAAASYTLTLPNTDGNADQVLKTDGSGNLDWVAQSGGGSLSGNMAGDIASNGHEIKFADSGAADENRLTFGASDDLEIYHDGSNSYIVEGGTGDLRLQAANLAVQNTFGQAMLEANNGGGVNLYYNTSLKASTLTDGLSVRGQLKIQNSGGATQYTLPAADGSANQVLQTNGSGTHFFRYCQRWRFIITFC